MEPADQDWIKDRDDAQVAVNRQVDEHQVQQLPVAQKVRHFRNITPAVGELLYLSRAEVERLLDIDAMLEALANALIIFSSGITSVPPRTAARVRYLGLLGAMAGYVPGVALEIKLVSVFPGNHAHGIPSHQGLIALFSED